MIHFSLFNHTTKCGYSKKFSHDRELNAWINYIQTPEDISQLGCPTLLEDGSCGCRITIKVIGEME